MTFQAVVARPPTSLAPGQGLLRAEHFQLAYVTNDIERACAVFRDRYGVAAYKGFDAATPDGGAIHIELAWVGGMMIELIQASGPGTDFYNDRLPSQSFAIRHHHVGYLIQDLTMWDRLMLEIDRGSWPIAFQGHAEGFMRFCYIEAEELGHYLEYILPEPDGIAFFESVPAS